MACILILKQSTLNTELSRIFIKACYADSSLCKFRRQTLCRCADTPSSYSQSKPFCQANPLQGLQGQTSFRKSLVQGKQMYTPYNLCIYHRQEALPLLKALKESFEKEGRELPTNVALGPSNDLLLRPLDCAVINSLHELHKIAGMPGYDSVRGVFWEGEDLYKGAGFKAKNHIQIAIINPNCIKGFFRPRNINKDYNNV